MSYASCVEPASVECVAKNLRKANNGTNDEVADADDIVVESSSDTGSIRAEHVAVNLPIIPESNPLCALTMREVSVVSSGNLPATREGADENEELADVSNIDVDMASALCTESVQAKHVSNNLPNAPESQSHCAVNMTDSSVVHENLSSTHEGENELADVNSIDVSMANTRGTEVALARHTTKRLRKARKPCCQCAYHSAVFKSNFSIARHAYKKVVARKNVKKTRWSEAEKDAVCSSLSEFIESKTVPGKKHCVKAIAESRGVLSGRSWKHVKFTVKNIITANHSAKKDFPELHTNSGGNVELRDDGDTDD